MSSLPDSRQLAAILDQAIHHYKVPGVSAAILHKGEIASAAAGVANVSTGVPLTTDSVMHIGSITKVLNATLVMQLVDDGVADLDAPIQRYLPHLRVRDKSALEAMTLTTLLNHTSGLDGEWLATDHDHDKEIIERSVERFADMGQIHEPGADYSYCNAATVIAGYAAQHLTERSWYKLAHERLFIPLQMMHAAATPEDALLYSASVGHFYKAERNASDRSSHAFLAIGMAPAGSTLMMSAHDLVVFAQAHLNGGVGANGARILSSEGAAAMRTVTFDNSSRAYTYPSGMGIGWKVGDDGVLTHAGTGPGVCSVLYAFPRQNFAAAILTNGDRGWLMIDELIGQWLAAVGVTTKPLGWAEVSKPALPVDIDPDRYVGTFENIMTRYRVRRTQAGLSLSRQMKFLICDNMTDQESTPLPLVPLGGERFLMDAGEGAGTPDSFRLFEFRNPAPDGRMRHIGSLGRLYLRSA